MTITYYRAVSTESISNFLKIIRHWHGSLAKSVWQEFLFWLFPYYVVCAVYRCVLPIIGWDDQFKKFVEILSTHQDMYIPLEFMLGFFVTTVIDRWRKSFQNIPYIESCAFAVSAALPGHGALEVSAAGMDTKLTARRTIIRYLVLSQILLFREFSVKVKKRFVDLRSLVDSKFLTENELTELSEELKTKRYDSYILPINWAFSILRTEKLNSNPQFMNAWNVINDWQVKLTLLRNGDFIPIPLAYPQAVFLAVRFYFLVCLFTRQHLDLSDHHAIDYFFPLLTSFQFIFIVGWMKVAEILLNPMGEDDDDFELNYVIDKNFYIGMTIVDSKDIELTENDEIPDKIGEDCLPFYRKDCEEDAIKNRALVGSTKNTMPNQGVMDKVEENSIQVVDDNWRDYNENHSDTSSILEGSQEDFADDLAA